ncbi:class I SAM-dependent methyltransferase [Oceanirhabdus sp. W0125-5]|uniref:class I SAM-dependent methyltransferase n=1 Tax=Oceanirhabdus sp. W0125-5 TaxID=2999116 RepID=UPI0022F2F2AD|nr:methyltransferase domain-containing protein [Oceanirhabdus sp. W0125-5]WBW95593.1 methyltransferase domain-containing protein [Oceanirhabdus sp. W0125-5]
MHKFNPINKKKLDNEWRREVFPPKKTLELLGIEKNDTIADIGCGIGYFTIPAAEIVDINNRIYGLDISQEMLDEVEIKAESLGIKNITNVKTDEYDLKLPDNSVSFGLMVNVLHEIEDKERLLKEINRITKENGKLAIIEWKKKETKMGPPVHHRISKDEVIKLCQNNNLNVEKEFEWADSFYGVVVS